MTTPSAVELDRSLALIEDPLFNQPIVRLGYLTDVKPDGSSVVVELKLPTPAHPAREKMVAAIEAAGHAAGFDKVRVDVSWKVQSRVGGAQSGRPDSGRLAGVKNIVVVAAGKGGVGKSTVATNLALALKQYGATVGLLDADVYGPSVPTMLGPAETPAATKPENKIVPAVHYGIKVMSVGFFVDREGAIVWRGPMVGKLLQQFVDDVEWGELDYLVIDLPPGTGDAQLSLAQMLPITGAVVVTTPQEVSVIDVIRAVAMFKKVEVPILGVVENMSDYVCPACGHHDEIFSRGGGKGLARELGTHFFGEIPIAAKVRYGGDVGRPVVLGAPDSEHAKIFMRIAAEAAGEIVKRNGLPSQKPVGLPVIR